MTVTTVSPGVSLTGGRLGWEGQCSHWPALGYMFPSGARRVGEVPQTRGLRMEGGATPQRDRGWTFTQREERGVGKSDTKIHCVWNGALGPEFCL